jgi:uncharacterized protein DUF3185
MQNVVGIACLVVGVVLIICGMHASASLGARLSELFTGALSDRTIWLYVVGVVATMLGLGMLLVGRRRTLARRLCREDGLWKAGDAVVVSVSRKMGWVCRMRLLLLPGFH